MNLYGKSSSRSLVANIERTEKYWQKRLGSSIERSHGQLGSKILMPFEWNFVMDRDANCRVVAKLVYNGQGGIMLGDYNTSHSCNGQIHLLMVTVVLVGINSISSHVALLTMT